MDQKENQMYEREKIQPPRNNISPIIFIVSLLITTLTLISSGIIIRGHLLIPVEPTPTPRVVHTPVPTLVVNLPLSSLDIITDAPSSMRIKTSYTIKVSLTPKGQARISDLMLEMATPTVSDVIPVGTPGVSLKNAFGPRLEPAALATLQSDTFVIDHVGPDIQPLDQPKVTWEWTVTPNESGTQFLVVDIEAYWNIAQGPPIRGPYRIGDKTFRVYVSAPTPVPTPTPTPEPFINPGHIDIGATITSLPGILLGAGGLGTILIIGLVSHRKRRARKKKSPVSQSSKRSSSRKKPTP